ncbi:MAG: discoidin domain-containing protein [Limnochordales bacterium]|nr:discoidin domain-containing protein [Limnochordales bacterium]
MNRLTRRFSSRAVFGLAPAALAVVAAASVFGGMFLALAPGVWGEGSTGGSVSPGTSTVTVTVETARKFARTNPLLFGINTAHWDETIFPGPASDMLLSANREVIGRVREAGVTILKYPGGTAADSYVWNNPRNPASEMDTDEFIAFCRAVGAEPWIQVNIPAGPEVAAAWVDYVNNLHHYNVKYWELGDEEYGDWAKGHAPPEVYAAKARQFIQAMKAKDPTIKVGISVVGFAGYDDWTRQVIRRAGDVIDMVVFSFYPLEPGQESPAAFVQASAKLRPQLDYIHRILREEQPDRADEILVMIGGWNTVSYNPTPLVEAMPNAIFVARMLAEMQTLDVDGANYWAVYNPAGKRGGEYGFLKAATHEPTYPWYVFKLFKEHWGDTVVATSSTAAHVKAYATVSDRDVGTGVIAMQRVSVFLVNLSATRTETVRLSAVELTGATYRAWILAEGKKIERWEVSGEGEVQLPPYSIVVVEAVRQAQAGNLDRAFVISQRASSVLPGYEADKAADLRRDTRWCSVMGSGTDPQWLELDLGFSYELARVAVEWEATYARRYQVQVSEDGQKWRTVARIESGDGGRDEIEFPAVTARFLRLYLEERADPRWGYSVWEVEVYRRRS